MIPIDWKIDRVAEDDLLKSICADPMLAPYQAAWLKAYENYRRRRGNAFGLQPLVFSADARKALKDLYENRRRSSAFVALREAPMPGCSRCGAPLTGHLDHHLPAKRFREFSVLFSNLVPTCEHCNSGRKQAKGKGAAWPERFMHPYFDRFAAKPLWRCVVIDPVAVEFEARPEPSLSPRLRALVRYNLENTLGWQFRNHQVKLWRSLPSHVLRKTPPGGTPGFVELDEALEDMSFSAVSTEGLNGWRAALIRGIRHDPPIRQHLLAEASRL